MASLWQPAPLSGIRVVELAGLAPGPFCGMILADYGATVLRIDRAHPQAHAEAGSSTRSPPPTADFLTRLKSSIALDLKSPGGVAVLRAILANADVLIDPFRPGVLESLGLAPSSLHVANPRLIVARLTGFRRDGPYSSMAGHDINYLAVSGVLSQLGRADGPPSFPGNLLGDFAGGGLVCATGILLALLARERRGGSKAGNGSGMGGQAHHGVGQIVEANMVDGVAYLGSFLRLTRKTPLQDGPRGMNLLDGGCPWYDTYETKDKGKYMSVGALEPKFFAELVKGLGLNPAWKEDRWDTRRWPELRAIIVEVFKSRTRAEWEEVFLGKDACCTPVLDQTELELAGYEQRAMVGLTVTPSRSLDQKQAWNPTGIPPGHGGEKVLEEWMGWRRNEQYYVEKGGLVKSANSKL